MNYPQLSKHGPLRFLILLLSLAAVAGYLTISQTWQLVDEEENLVQIRMFLSGQYQEFKYIATTPAYHGVIAFLACLLNAQSVNSLRLISLVLSLSAVPVFFFAARRLDEAEAPLATSQFFFLPILLPFFFLLYTDVLSLGLVLLSVYGALTHREYLAGVAGILAVAVRQNQIVWLLFVFLLVYLIENGYAMNREAIKNHLRRCWIFLIGFAAFALFVLLNHGIAMGDREMHPPFTFHLGNVYFSLFFFLMVFLPMHLFNFRKVCALVRRNPWVLPAMGLLLAIYLPTFKNTHPYNFVPGFLHNMVLKLAELSLWTRILFFIPIGYAILSILVTPLKQPAFYLVYPFWIFTLVPAWLIEERYYLAAFSLFLLFRERQSRGIEYTSLVYSMVMGSFFLWGISQRWFFL
ncbi:MAG: hypothetical protein AABY87_08770 [bacterium]